MKLKVLTLALAAIAAIAPARAAEFVNLTPTPKQMTVGSGTLALPAEFMISYSGLDSEMVAEISKFATAFNAATGLKATPADGAEGLFSVSKNSSIAEEGYTLKVTSSTVDIEASTPAGLFYAFQTVKKILPANVMAGVKADGPYSLPVVTINDEPRYPWRGMELDCARHFFSMDQLKKMLRIMASYKMNRMHWHLTDDQGWRLEMPKYPKLTGDAGRPVNNYWFDFDNRQSYLLNEPYGPYFYTVEEMKELVAYAKELHIEICPEIDLPGHMQAAIAAYPEFSTTPNGQHPVRYWPGVSTDILDISNPAVVQFTKDIMDQLIEIFPYEYIHIGGDECPTTAWANSSSCQQFKKEYGLSSDRAIQNWLTKELADYVKPQGRRLICWNEVISTSGADTKLAQDADILVYCWLNAGATNNPSQQAANLGLRSVWCSTSHYYLDYPQNAADASFSMGGTISLETVYKAVPDYDASKSELFYGVNCNLWTEYICEDKHLEYNALPRMIAVAETGWTPAAKKDWTSFLKRFNADTKLLDLGNYTYGKHYVDGSAQEVVYPEADKWYRLITQASADANRKDRCIELVRSGSDLISSLSATAGQLWTNTQAAEGADNYDWQFWSFEADPAGSGNYAMVNRKQPSGSVSPAMSGSSVNARWTYDNTTKHYDFVLGENFSTDAAGNIYSIRSTSGSTWYINCAQKAQNLAVNNWADPTDGNGGMWLFALEGYVPAGETPEFTPLKEGTTYVIANSEAKFAGTAMTVTGTEAMHTTDEWAPKVWVLENSSYADGVQTCVLKNVATGRYLGAPAATAVTSATEAAGSFAAKYSGNLGYPLTTAATASEAATVSITSAGDGAYKLTVGGKTIFPIPASSEMLPGALSANEVCPREQGSCWTITPATETEIDAVEDETNQALGTFYTTAETWSAPAIENWKATGSPVQTGSTRFTAKYVRTAYVISYLCKDANGTLWATVNDVAPVGQAYTPAVPMIDFLSDGQIQGSTAAFTPTADTEITVIYTTEAIGCISKVTKAVTEITPGATYAIHDAHSSRNAWRYATDENTVLGTKTIEGQDTHYLWTLDPLGNGYSVMNVATGKYVTNISTTATAAKLTKTPREYDFTYNADGGYWTIKCASNGNCWDGLEDGTMVGWTAPGHPMELWEYELGDARFRVTIEEVNGDTGKTIRSREQLVKPGASVIFVAAERPNLFIKSIEGNEGLDNILKNITVTVTYSAEEDAIEEVQAPTPGNVRGIYDLQGRKLDKITHPGIFIVNGKKVIVK